MQNPRTPRKVPRIRASAEETSEQETRCRSYELYEARGRGDGHDVEDWLEAETEITARAQKTAA